MKAPSISQRTVLASLEPVLCSAGLVLAALSFRTFYGDWHWLLPVVGSILTGASVGVVAHFRQWRGLQLTLVAAFAFVVYGLYVVYPGALYYALPTLTGLRALADGIVSGWANMLTIGLPADTSGDVLILPVILGFAGGLVSALLALKSRLVLAVTVPILVVFGAGLAFTASRPGEWLLLTGVLGACCLLIILLRTSRLATADQEGIDEQDADAVGLDLTARRWHSTIGRVVFGIPGIALAASVGVASAAAIATDPDRADPRDLKPPHFTLLDELTPLVYLKPQLEEPTPRELFKVRITPSDADVDRVRIAALTEFDGALWRQPADFLVAGSTLDGAPELARPPVQVRLEVDVTSLRQPFLPVVGQPTHVDGDSLAFDPGTGTLVSTLGSVSGVSYTVDAEVADPTGIESASAPVGMEPLKTLPALPDWADAAIEPVAAGQLTPWLALSAIETELREGGYSLDAEPGHSIGAIGDVLDPPPGEQKVGYAEQYASAFAVIARSKRYATRVAVGYLLDEDNRDADGRYVVTTSSAHAWPEVFLNGYGWFPFEPTNFEKVVSGPPPEQQDVQPKGENRPPVDPSDLSEEAPGAGGAPVEEDPWWRPVLIMVLLLIVLPVVLVAAIVLAKLWRRRRRRQQGSPADRIAAAWRETVDRLRESGVKAPESATALEIAGDAEGSLRSSIGPPLRGLAGLVTVAVCAPAEPTADQAQRAWQLEAEFRSALDSTMPWATRVRRLADPRPLLHRAPRRDHESPRARRTSVRLPAGT